jgi:hypothetical protein
MQDIVAFAAVAGPVVAAAGLALVVRGQRLQNRALELQLRQLRFNSLTALHQELISPAMQRALRFIFNTEPDALTRPRDEDDLEQVELVLRTFDLLGHRLQSGVLPVEETLQTEWITVLAVWPRLVPFVEMMQKERNVPYKRYFRWLAERAEEYRRQHYPHVEIRYFNVPYRPGPAA